MKVYFDARQEGEKLDPTSVQCDRIEEGDSGLFLFYEDEDAMYEERQIGYVPYERLFYAGPDGE